MPSIPVVSLLVGGLLLAASHAEAAFCLTLTRQTTGEVTDLFDLDITGSTGTHFSLAMLEKSDPSLRRAATGSAVVDGADLFMDIHKTTVTAINDYRCQLDLASLSGVCTHHFTFADPADGTTGRATRNAAVATSACP